VDEELDRYIINVIDTSQASAPKPPIRPGIPGIDLSNYYLLSTRVRGMGGEFRHQVASFLKSFLQNLGYARPSLEDACDYMLGLDSSPDGFYVKDLSNTYVHANPAMALILEKAPQELVGLTDRDVYSPRDASELDDAFARAVQGELVQLEAVRTIKGQQKRLLEVLVAKRGRDYEPIGVYGICRDISDCGDVNVKSEIQDTEYRSLAMQDTKRQCLRVAETDCTVLLLGESGTGKDYLARYIHDHSRRSRGAFKLINCGAMTETLVESELFGHEKGAFTGATDRRKGALESANGGTAFLNEMGEMVLPSQAKLLSFLDTKRFQRVGAQEDIAADVRLIAATNRNLRRDVASGKFRKDLYYRLNVFSIFVPPLRERIEDIPILTERLLSTLLKKENLSSVPKISSAAMQKLRSYSWPGNVRELKNVLERALVLSHGDRVDKETIVLEGDPDSPEQCTKTSAAIVENHAPAAHSTGQQSRIGGPTDKPADAKLKELFGKYVIQQEWTRARLATHLGVDSSTLKKWLKEAGIAAGRAGRPRKKSVE
jgi:PAS domain S-box-containing protein